VVIVGIDFLGKYLPILVQPIVYPGMRRREVKKRQHKVKKVSRVPTGYLPESLKLSGR
jgi:hypothetical protein